MKKRHLVIGIVVGVLVILIGIAIGVGNRAGIAGHDGNIGVVEVEEVITSATAKRTIRHLEAFTEDPGIAAIIIHVDSPGGGVAASQEIYCAVAQAREQKKVVVSMGALAASGGYYISLPADLIVANPGTITGSIGVIMEFPNVEELLKKIGMRFEVVKSREHKDIGSPYRTMTDRDRRLLQDVVGDVYDQFVSATCENRSVSRDSVMAFADGRILSGRQACALGLLDTLGTFAEAVEITGAMVGIEHPNLIYAPRSRSLVEILTEPLENLLRPRIGYVWQ